MNVSHAMSWTPSWVSVGGEGGGRRGEGEQKEGRRGRGGRGQKESIGTTEKKKEGREEGG